MANDAFLDYTHKKNAEKQTITTPPVAKAASSDIQNPPQRPSFDSFIKERPSFDSFIIGMRH